MFPWGGRDSSPGNDHATHNLLSDRLQPKNHKRLYHWKLPSLPHLTSRKSNEGSQVRQATLAERLSPSLCRSPSAPLLPHYQPPSPPPQLVHTPGTTTTSYPRLQCAPTYRPPCPRSGRRKAQYRTDSPA